MTARKPPPPPKCERCGEPAEHKHHWAPIAYFGRPESELWPTAWLCAECHRFWHDRIQWRRIEEGVDHVPGGERHGGDDPISLPDAVDLWQDQLETYYRSLYHP